MDKYEKKIKKIIRDKEIVAQMLKEDGAFASARDVVKECSGLVIALEVYQTLKICRNVREAKEMTGISEAFIDRARVEVEWLDALHERNKHKPFSEEWVKWQRVAMALAKKLDGMVR